MGCSGSIMTCSSTGSPYQIKLTQNHDEFNFFTGDMQLYTSVWMPEKVRLMLVFSKSAASDVSLTLFTLP